MSEADSTEQGRWIRSAVEAYERPLVRYAARITGDVERGRDVAQEAFLRLCRADRASIDGHLAEWLFTVCRNRALDVKRKEMRMATLPADRAAEQPGAFVGRSRWHCRGPCRRMNPAKTDRRRGAKPRSPADLEPGSPR